MDFFFNTIVRNQIVYITKRDDQWYIGSNRLCFPEAADGEVFSIAINQNVCIVLLVENKSSGRFGIPDNIFAFNYEGSLLWTIGEMLDKESSLPYKKIIFSSMIIHTKETLSQLPWSNLFGKVTLDESHDYLTAYDGGQQWLFDITDRKYLHRVFTH